MTRAIYQPVRYFFTKFADLFNQDKQSSFTIHRITVCIVHKIITFIYLVYKSDLVLVSLSCSLFYMVNVIHAVMNGNYITVYCIK